MFLQKIIYFSNVLGKSRNQNPKSRPRNPKSPNSARLPRNPKKPKDLINQNVLFAKKRASIASNSILRRFTKILTLDW